MYRATSETVAGLVFSALGLMDLSHGHRAFADRATRGLEQTLE